MSYDQDRVQFTEDEHAMASKLDGLIEHFTDGFQIGDLGAVAGTLDLVKYIAAGGDRGQTVQRLYTLAIMLERDNAWLIPKAVAGTD